MPMQATLDADFSQFLGELDRTKRELLRWTPDVAKISKGLDRLSDSLDGSKTFAEAAKMVAALDRVGGAERLTAREARRIGPAIDEAAAKFTALGQRVPPEIAKAKTELDRLRQSTNGVGTAAESMTAKLTRGLGGFAAGLGLGVGASIAVGAGSLIRGLAGDAVALTPLVQGFERMQGGAANARAELNLLREASRGLIGTNELLRASNEANVLGLGKMGLEFDQVVGVATRLGRVVGKDATSSVADLTNALGRGSSEVLNNLGIQLRANDAYEEFAKRNGLVASKLTDTQKATAFATVGFERAAAAAEALGEQELTVYEQATRVVTALHDMGVELLGAGDKWEGLGSILGDVADQIGIVRRAISLLSTVPGAALRVGIREMAADIERLADLFPSARATRASSLLGLAGLPGMAAGSSLTGLGGAGSSLRDTASLLRSFAFGDNERDLQTVAGQLFFFANGSSGSGSSGAAGGNGTTGGADNTEAQRWRREIEQLTGAANIRNAERLAKQIAEIAKAGRSIATDNLEDLARQLIEARDLAAQAGRAITGELGEPLDAVGRALYSLPIKAKKPLLTVFDGGLLRVRELEQATRDLRGEYAEFTGTINSTNPLANTLVGLTPAVERTNKKFTGLTTSTRNWRVELSNVSQAFAQLAQVSGGLDPVTRQIGVFVAGLESAEQLVTSIGKIFKEDFNFGDSKAAKNVAAGLAGGLVGFELGGLFSNRAGGALAGAAGGAAAGASVGGFVGAGIGAIAGGIGGYFGAAGKASELRKLKDLQADQLVAQYGSLEELLTTVGRLGLNQQQFLERFYGEPKEFAKGVNDLTIALERERRAADALAQSLGDVSKRQGVLSRADVEGLAKVRPGSPGEDVARGFLGAQSDLTLKGLQRAGSALERMVLVSDKELAQIRKDVEAELGSRDADALEAAVTGRTDALRLEKSTGVLDRFGSAAGGLGAGLLLQFDSLTEQGYTTADALALIQEPASALEDILTRTGRDGGAAFGQLRGMLSIVNDEALQPALDLGLGLGQVIGGLGNRALLSGEAFTQLAGGVAESYFAMEGLGKGGVDAVRLLQTPLQNIWQLQEDFGYQVDENTQKLLDFAESSGLLGDRFRPAAERAANGIELLVEKFDEFLDRLGPGLETAAGNAGTLLDDLRRQAEFPSLPGNPDATWKVNAELAGSMEVRVDEANVSIELDGDVLADAVIRRLPGRVEFVNG